MAECDSCQRKVIAANALRWHEPVHAEFVACSVACRDHLKRSVKEHGHAPDSKPAVAVSAPKISDEIDAVFASHDDAVDDDEGVEEIGGLIDKIRGRPQATVDADKIASNVITRAAYFGAQVTERKSELQSDAEEIRKALRETLQQKFGVSQDSLPRYLQGFLGEWSQWLKDTERSIGWFRNNKFSDVPQQSKSFGQLRERSKYNVELGNALGKLIGSTYSPDESMGLNYVELNYVLATVFHKVISKSGTKGFRVLESVFLSS